MKRMSLGLVLAVVGGLVAAAVPASADTLELRDGRVINGRFMGGTAAQLRFESSGSIESYSVEQIVALSFTGTGNSGNTANTYNAPAPTLAPGHRSSTNSVSSGESQRVIIPAGTTLLVRMIDSVDSSKNHVGDKFHASLENDLIVDNILVARRGTDLYGRLAEAKEAGHVSGSADLKLELTDMAIDHRSYPIMTGEYEAKGKGRGENTAKKVGGGAAVGAIIGAIAGGGKGAAIGAGVGGGAGAAVNVMTRGQQVRVPSETLLEFRLTQPVSVVSTNR
ncbi:MAG TPA: hypothetical protein VOA41_05555 [Candidatus Dormibacteraeota bacterium]|nr:hypothetical protein [Candidatus Dormibacteraeota bacterium]